MPDLLSIYPRLPYSLKTVIASARGYQLRSWRYSRETESSIAQALARETWTAGQWKSWQEETLARTLWHAAKSVPHYRRYWEDQRGQGSRAPVEDLQNWPVLDKEAVRANPRSFLADGVNPRTQIVEHTSGTSGKPLTLWMSRQAVRTWYALAEARWRGWYGLSRRDRWGILGGQMVVPYAQYRPPYWVWNAGMNQLYCSSYHLAAHNVGAYLDAIRSHRLVYLLGYASSLYSLAYLALEQRLKVPALKAVISNAEPLYAHQREVIYQAFQCPVYDTYGLSENVCGASECLHGSLHLWPEAGMTEILDDESNACLPAGETGRFVCTGFLNQSMPLIRYETGDRGSLSVETRCPCGRTLPMLRCIEGREDDVLLTREGRRIGRLDPVFKADLPIREAQIIQESLERIRVLYVPAHGCSKSSLDGLAGRLRERMGDVDVELEEVSEIPRTSNGKFRAVISKCQS